MSASGPTLLTLGFGALEQRVWGVAWAHTPDGSAFTVLGAGEDAAAVPGVVLNAGGQTDEWRLDGDHTSLTATPAGEAVEVVVGDDPIEGFDQLCRVSGRFELAGEEHAVDCLGLRTSRSVRVDLDRFDSIRALTTWFEPDEGFALTAFRARKAKGHDSDLVSAAVLGAKNSAPAVDPRFSTTYAAGGWPVRAGLELWVDGEDEQQYPRRASGEAMGASAQAGAGDLELRADLFRWHSRGRPGAGVYVVEHRRR